MALHKENGEIFEVLHSFVLQDCIANPGDVLPTVLDINSTTGALVFVCFVGGIFIVFIAILDSLKPPNFPPGPRWLPFRGDSSGFCEKPLRKTTITKLADQFGPVVGLRPNASPRNPLVLVLDDGPAKTVEQAVKNGFLDRPNGCSQPYINKFTGIPTILSGIRPILTRKDVQETAEKCALETSKDLIESMKNNKQSTNRRSLISVAAIAVLFEVITGQRVKVTSPYMANLHHLLGQNSELNLIFNDQNWNVNSDIIASATQYYSKLIVALADLEEGELSKVEETTRLNIMRLLRENNGSMSFADRGAVIATILIKANIEHFSSIINEFIEIITLFKISSQNLTVVQRDMIFTALHSKENSFELFESLIRDLSRNIPTIKVGRRYSVLKSFYLNGFIVPQGSNVQIILSDVESQCTVELENSAEKIMTIVLSRLLSEAYSCPAVLKTISLEN